MIGHIETMEREAEPELLQRVFRGLGIEATVGVEVRTPDGLVDRFARILPHLPDSIRDQFANTLDYWEEEFAPELPVDVEDRLLVEDDGA
jgi:hypothetical protein